MKRFLQSYGTLCFSLIVLFASGIFIGRMTAPKVTKTAKAQAEAIVAADAWVAAASRSLVSDLKLDENQQSKLQESLSPVAEAIFSDRERALFQMHLRLLELHDHLVKDVSMTESQLKRLAASRAKLKDLIIAKFPNSVRQNPSLAVQK